MTDKNAIPHTPLYVILSGGIFDSTWSDGEIKAAEFPDYMLVGTSLKKRTGVDDSFSTR